MLQVLRFASNRLHLIQKLAKSLKSESTSREASNHSEHIEALFNEANEESKNACKDVKPDLPEPKRAQIRDTPYFCLNT